MAKQPRLPLRKFLIDGGPSDPCRLIPLHPPRLAGRNDVSLELVNEWSQVLVRIDTAFRQQLRAAHTTPEKAVGKAVARLRLRQIPPELLYGDVPDDGYMRAGGLYRGDPTTGHHRLESAIVPGMPKDG